MKAQKNILNLRAILMILTIASLMYLSLPHRSEAEEIIKLRVWGFPEADSFKGVFASVREFERRHPNIKVVMGTPGGAAGIDPQKLMTAVASKTPPDILWFDRFTISDWATRGVFMRLNELVERDGVNPDDFYKACWDEAVYKGNIYGLPWDTDCRGLYYNKGIFKEVGLDPNHPPQDWDELIEYSKRLTIAGDKGRYDRIGFAPNYGNSWLYLYGWLNGGEFMSTDGTKCTLNDPKIVEGLQYMVDAYDAIGGYRKILGFEKSGGFGVTQDTFIMGKVAMVINGNWSLDDIARYKPDLDFGVALPPAPKGKKPLTWSGGFALVIPKGCKHIDETWELAKWLSLEDGRLFEAKSQLEYNNKIGKGYYIPRLTANRKTNEKLFALYPGPNENIQKAIKTFLSMMDSSRYRPVTPVSATLWDEHARGMTEALQKDKTPKQALDDSTRKVQKELDRFLNPPPYKLLKWEHVIIIAAIIGGILLTLYLISVWHYFSKTTLHKDEGIAGILFVSPWLLGFIVFMLGPMFVSIVLCFCEYDVIHPAKFCGLDNFKNMFQFIQTEAGDTRGKIPLDPLFWKSLWNTLYITLFGVPLSLVIGLGIAVLLNAEIKGMPIYRTFFYLPSIVPAVATAILWLWLLNPQFGWISIILRAIGIESPNWFDDPNWSRPSLILMMLWGAGGSMIIWLAGLKGIPRHLYEAAQIDGCNRIQSFFSITIPMLTPYIFFNLIMGIIGYLQIFTQAFMVCAPPTAGPNDTLLFFVFYLFNNAFVYFKMGYASALAWILFAIILILTLIQLKLAKRWVYYEGSEEGGSAR